MLHTIIKNFKSSFSEIKSVHILTTCAILLALRVILGMLEINIGNTFRISFSYLPIAIGGFLFGPIASCFIAFLGDVITLIVHPTGFPNFGIMFAQVLSGFIYGILLYKQSISLIRTSITCLTITIFCHLIITSISLNIAYNIPYEIMMPARLISNSILLPINIIGLYVSQKTLSKIKIPILNGRILKR